jgi:hypothetical protein
MPLTTLLAILQDAPAPASGAQGTVKIIAGVLAVVLVIIIVMRRRGGGKKKEEEDF